MACALPDPRPPVDRELSVIFENSGDEESFENLELEVSHLRKKCQQHQQRYKENRRELLLCQLENEELRKSLEELDRDAEAYAQETQEFAKNKLAELQQAHGDIAYWKTLCKKMAEGALTLSWRELDKYQEQMHAWLVELHRKGEGDEDLRGIRRVG